MEKQMKKALAILALTSITISMCAACTKTGSKPGEYKASDYPEEITVDVFDTLSNFQGIQSGWFADVVKKKLMSMFTDPNHLRVQDPGKVEGNPVFIYLDAFCKDEYFAEFLPDYQNLDELKEHYQRGGLGDVKVKKFLNKVLEAELGPIRERRKMWEQRIPDVYDILQAGSEVAEKKAAETLKDVKAAMRINYFDDEDFLN